MAKKKGTLVPKLLSMGCALLVLGGMALAGNLARQKTAEPTTEGTLAPKEEETPQDGKLSLIAVGDNMMSDTMIAAGLQPDNSYNFTSMYAPVKGLIASADLAVVNQETILGGEAFDYSGYPLYNSPWQVGDALIETGFNAFLCANNHAMDMGAKGIESAISYFEQKNNIAYFGIYKDAASYSSLKLIEKNGIKLAILNYTFGTNGIDLPEDKPWLVNQMEKEKMAQDIAAARQQADIVAVFPHWGTEYSPTVSTAQSELAQFFCDNGVQLVIGSHPHVIEPVQWLESESGNRTLVYYSLGNFLAHQNGADRMLGAAAQVTITKEAGRVTVDGKAVPLVNHIAKTEEKWEFKVYPLSDYTQALASSHRESNLTLTYLNDLANRVLGEFKAQ